MLCRGVLLHELRQFVDKGGPEAGHALVVSARETHGEFVRHEDAVAGHDRCLGIEFPPKGRGDLDWLQPRLEGLGERTVDGALKTFLKAVQ